MGIKRLESMKECFIAQVEAQMGHLECVDACELGEVIDIIKDLEEAIYYHTITEAMEEPKEQEIRYYTETPMSIKKIGDKHHDLESYLQELTSEITALIKDASPEEKQLLHRKIAALATKIEQS